MRSQDQHFQPQQQDNQQSKVFYELSAMILNILRSPPTPFDFPDDVTSASGVSGGQSSAVGVGGRRQQVGPMGAMGMGQITPAGFASLLLGISLALMLCGSVTFFIGFMLMPWVVGLVMVFYFVGLVSSLSVLGRAILCHSSSSPPCSAPPSPRKDCSSWKFS
ncbi:OLC1v1028609C1 [Oldenlandia corymbosa var. corymbosa]|uniref:OLC1v1028609C1 n=1 Tax=Oldenlandia corymbosa var. corymbosa TaxID=529605 RepID=A0AAV1CC52_OLDCO|nr:OLC1v1028609C1 [Oldenlandia corymbosa var. corymbosa]